MNTHNIFSFLWSRLVPSAEDLLLNSDTKRVNLLPPTIKSSKHSKIRRLAAKDKIRRRRIKNKTAKASRKKNR